MNFVDNDSDLPCRSHFIQFNQKFFYSFVFNARTHQKQNKNSQQYKDCLLRNVRAHIKMLILQQMKQQVLTIDWLAMNFFCVYRMGKMGAQLNKCIQYFVNGNDYNSFITCWIYIYAFIYLFILTIFLSSSSTRPDSVKAFFLSCRN